jgi:hypothetical protein
MCVFSPCSWSLRERFVEPHAPAADARTGIRLCVRAFPRLRHTPWQERPDPSPRPRLRHTPFRGQRGTECGKPGRIRVDVRHVVDHVGLICLSASQNFRVSFVQRHASGTRTRPFAGQHRRHEQKTFCGIPLLKNAAGSRPLQALVNTKHGSC